MAYFEWADDLVIDGGSIDADHLILVDLVNELHTATSQGTGHEVVASVLERLITYTKEHLAREELLMASIGFPDLERHKVGHQHFTEDLEKLQEKYDAGSISVASHLSAVLRDWLSLHIRRSDKEFKQFIQKKGVRSSGGK